MIESYLDGILLELLLSPVVLQHHIHLADGKVISSAPVNLKKVLVDIEKTMPC